ncbi:hypothetical protein GCM10008019_29460 [Deinococcus soli (ex Cha et al. 2016)]|nr:hypothetical protein GCM10008019_29460 [Deinococcus soli (ex Cha et al. 2016)]
MRLGVMVHDDALAVTRSLAWSGWGLAAAWKKVRAARYGGARRIGAALPAALAGGRFARLGGRARIVFGRASVTRWLARILPACYSRSGQCQVPGSLALSS